MNKEPKPWIWTKKVQKHMEYVDPERFNQLKKEFHDVWHNGSEYGSTLEDIEDKYVILDSEKNIYFQTPYAKEFVRMLEDMHDENKRIGFSEEMYIMVKMKI